jgi:hypothetical protein
LGIIYHGKHEKKTRTSIFVLFTNNEINLSSRELCNVLQYPFATYRYLIDFCFCALIFNNFLSIFFQMSLTFEFSLMEYFRHQSNYFYIFFFYMWREIWMKLGKTSQVYIFIIVFHKKMFIFSQVLYELHKWVSWGRQGKRIRSDNNKQYSFHLFIAAVAHWDVQRYFFLIWLWAMLEELDINELFYYFRKFLGFACRLNVYSSNPIKTYSNFGSHSVFLLIFDYKP